MPPPVREHPLARGKWAERASEFLGKAWDKGWLPPPDLDPQALWSIATKSFGDQAKQAESEGRFSSDAVDFRTRLERLAEAIRAEARLNPLGQAMAYGQLTRVIRQRLRLGRHFVDAAHPRGFDMAPPIIVIGHMRSGTTRIHKLLAADPAHSATRHCDSYHPVPAVAGVRRLKSAVDLTMLRAFNPWLHVIHPMSAGGVEEELGWLGSALQASIYETQWHIPSYSTWSEARDATPVYAEFARIVRMDAAHRANADKPRVMKVPAFAENLPELLAQFPDARLVVAQRETGAVLRSAVSLAANQMAVQSDHCDLAAIEQFWRRKIALREERMAAALANWSGPISRLQFDDLNTDWERAMTRAYAELGLAFNRSTLSAMRAEMARHENGLHRDHAAQLASFENEKPR